MTKTTNISRTRLPSFPQERTAAVGGWRIKERKTAASAEPTRRPKVPHHVRPKNTAAKTVRMTMPEPQTRREGWRPSRKGIAGTGALLVALITMMAASSLWLKSPNALQTTEAEAQISSPAVILEQDANQQPAALERGYQLYLGTYRSELAARLTWAGLEADSATMLVGLNPFFKPSEEGEGVFYHVLAGKHSTYHEANSHCSWLREHGVDCSIVDG